MTSWACRRARRAFLREDPKLSARMAAHAQTCSDCRERLVLWEDISRVAPMLRRDWESPDLPGRIARGLEAERARKAQPAPPPAVRTPRIPAWAPIAASIALFVIAGLGLRLFTRESGQQLLVTPNFGADPLLTEKKATEVERAEAAYVRSIDDLAALARPRLDRADSALSVSYREKLLVLDSAIGECRRQIETNRFNTNLRRELLAMYQEKQRTLEQVMKERPS